MNRTHVGWVRWEAVLCGVALSLTGCGGAPSQPAEGAEETQQERASTKKDLVALFQRERTEPWNEVDVVDPGGAWSASIESAAPARVSEERGVVVVEADIGEADPLTCLVYPEAIDAGSLIHAVLANATKQVEVRKLAPYSVGAVAHAPAVFVRALYHAQLKDEVAAGDLKLMVVSRFDHPVLCTLDVPGYAETFTRLGAGFAGSFEWKSPKPAPKRTEVWAAAVNGAPVGFQSAMFSEEPQKRVRSVNVATMLLPIGEAELEFVDSVSMTILDKDGRVVEGRWFKGANSQAVLDIELRSKGTQYQYRGSAQGRAVEGSFKTKAGLSSPAYLRAHLGGLRTQKKPRKIVLQEYHPGVDPTRATAVEYTPAADDGGRKFQVGIGDATFDLLLSEDGYPEVLVMPVKGLELVFKRVDAVGTL